MKLQTQCYLPEPTREAVDPMIGLRDLRKGLNTLLTGYLLSVAAILGAVGIIWYLIAQTSGGAVSRQVADNASIVIFTLALLLPLTGISSLILIVRGKWLCLASAPEQYHAKWMMYLAILCILAGPFLNWGALLVGNDKPSEQRRAPSSSSMSLARVQEELDEYKNGVPEMGTRDYVQLAGKGIGMLSGVFLVLFLRAVALSWGSPLRARFAELYLVFLALLVAGVVVLLRNPSYMLARPQLLLGLGAGWLLAGPWYFFLILSTSIGASSVLARGAERANEPAPLPAPRMASLPPIE